MLLALLDAPSRPFAPLLAIYIQILRTGEKTGELSELAAYAAERLRRR